MIGRLAVAVRGKVGEGRVSHCGKLGLPLRRPPVAALRVPGHEADEGEEARGRFVGIGGAALEEGEERHVGERGEDREGGAETCAEGEEVGQVQPSLLPLRAILPECVDAGLLVESSPSSR